MTRAMTEDDLVQAVFDLEGDRYGDQTTQPPIDQPTARGGLTLAVVQAYYEATAVAPAAPYTATVEDLHTMTHAHARTIVGWHLRDLATRAHLVPAAIPFEPLRVQLLDFAYNSGEKRAVRWLQRVLRAPRTGDMDPTTINRLALSDLWLVHQALIGARLEMIDRATDRGGSVSPRYEEGLENRALSFSLLEVP